MSAQIGGPSPPWPNILVAGGNTDLMLDPSVSVMKVAGEDGDDLQVGWGACGAETNISKRQVPEEGRSPDLPRQVTPDPHLPHEDYPTKPSSVVSIAIILILQVIPPLPQFIYLSSLLPAHLQSY